ncbi:MAG TPA: ornithine cyclodeaminase family protein [Clostridiaceae bacterium]|nr:ornithine cyclodeaminase family protein [Clostridiaceae bacterium]
MSKNKISCLFLSQEDLISAGCFDLKAAMACARQALMDYQNGKILFPEKIVQIFNEETQERINCLPATLLEEKVCGVKWVSVFPLNPVKYGKQNLSALILLSEIETGFPVAVMEGTLCSNIRVAAMGGIAADFLARKNSETIGFIGAGEQAKMHLLAMKSVRPSLKICKVASKYAEEEDKFISDMQAVLPDIKFISCRTILKDAITGSDIIVTATSAQAPLLKAEWIKEGAFYSHIGGWEDEFAVAKKASKIVCDDWDTVKHRTQTLSRMFKCGELTDNDIYANLHEIVMGKKAPRETEDEFIYFNAVGLSYVDVSIAYNMFKTCRNAGIGTHLRLQDSMIFDKANLIEKIII